MSFQELLHDAALQEICNNWILAIGPERTAAHRQLFPIMAQPDQILWKWLKSTKTQKKNWLTYNQEVNEVNAWAGFINCVRFTRDMWKDHASEFEFACVHYTHAVQLRERTIIDPDHYEDYLDAEHKLGSLRILALIDAVMNTLNVKQLVGEPD